MSLLRPKSGIHQIKAHMLANDSSDYPPIRIALNSNESAFGPCQSAIDAARASSVNLARYLENPVSLLAPLIAKRQGLEVDRIAIGHGSDDLLARLARVYLGENSEMIRSCNGYLKTPNYAFANNATPVSVIDRAFTTSVDAILEAVTEKTRMVYVANPENPAGTYISGNEIRRLHLALPSHVVLVLDCAYEEYVDASDYEAGHLLARESENIVVTRTFSKIYGLAGARVGWMYASKEIIDMVTRIGLTFPVASSSVAAAMAALEDETHINYVFQTNRRLRNAFSKNMKNLGLKVYPSQTNFVLLEFEPGEHSAAACADHLSRQGIAIRRFASVAYENCIRVTIGIEADMKRIEAAITVFLNNHN
jgi:histidinol-phosphate aminotransferase|tara:strand:+ start:2758 stop:3852 length:1095 start_codon:yes stop_codon:yes gene_type:complete